MTESAQNDTEEGTNDNEGRQSDWLFYVIVRPQQWRSMRKTGYATNDRTTD